MTDYDRERDAENWREHLRERIVWVDDFERDAGYEERRTAELEALRKEREK